MHLEGPWLSTTGKKKGKVKFRNAEEARKARELDEAWKQLQKKWAVEAEDKKRRRALEAAPLVYTLSGRETTRIASRDTGHTGAVRTKDIPKYTGTKIKGIGTMHKSNAVPIFSDEEAVAISQMRR
jgi:N-acetylglucosamine-6-phosphate deacetylase